MRHGYHVVERLDLGNLADTANETACDRFGLSLSPYSRLAGDQCESWLVSTEARYCRSVITARDQVPGNLMLRPLDSSSVAVTPTVLC